MQPASIGRRLLANLAAGVPYAGQVTHTAESGLSPTSCTHMPQSAGGRHADNIFCHGGPCAELR
jgi:hypothetical protein